MKKSQPIVNNTKSTDNYSEELHKERNSLWQKQCNALMKQAKKEDIHTPKGRALFEAWKDLMENKPQ